MKKQIDSKHISQVTAALMTSDAKSAIRYLDDKTIVRATWHDKPKSNNKRETMLVTIGQPNYKEREYIKRCAFNCVELPKSVILKPWPKGERK